MLIDEIDDFLIDQPQHHLDDIHGFRIGYAHTLNEGALLTDPLQHIVDLGTSPVNDYRVHADHFQQRYVMSETLFEIFLDHGIATIFDDNGSPVKALDIGQRLGQNFCFVL